MQFKVTHVAGEQFLVQIHALNEKRFQCLTEHQLKFICRIGLCGAAKSLVQDSGFGELVKAAKAFKPDVIHAHDWLVTHTAVTLKEHLDLPLVATIHATEAGLWNGWITSRLSLIRHNAERWLVRAATRTIVCSEAMRAEVSAALKVPADELTKVHNAVDLAAWSTSSHQQARARAVLGVRPDVPLVVLAGRIEWEKGGDVAVQALPAIRRARPGKSEGRAIRLGERPDLAIEERERAGDHPRDRRA